MEKVFVFCDSGTCGKCDKCCWNDCDDEACQNRCSFAKWADELYANDDTLVKELDRVAIDEDSWLVGVAAAKVEELLERVKKLEAVAEAAREHTVSTGCDYAGCENANCARCTFYKLREALAALDDDKCRNCGAPLEKCGPQLWERGKKCCPECTHQVNREEPEHA